MNEIFLPPPGAISPLVGTPAVPAGKAPLPASGASFQEVLAQARRQPANLKFSAHAEERLRSRNIALSDQDRNRLSEAVDRVGARGGRESLVLMRDVAYVVSVGNRTVITAVDTKDAGNVFTQIDSAVLA